jgi:hypothetical protein
MDLMLKDKVAIVTGAGKGIGKAITQALTDEGCSSLPDLETHRASCDSRMSRPSIWTCWTRQHPIALWLVPSKGTGWWTFWSTMSGE